MFKATIKGLLAHKVRLALTALAIVLGVGLVAGTYILTHTISRSFDTLFQTANKGVAVSVQAIPKFTSTGFGGEDAGPPERVPDALVAQIEQVPGVRTAEGTLTGYAQLVVNGKAVTTGGAPTLGVSSVEDPELSAATDRGGRRPEGAGEI